MMQIEGPGVASSDILHVPIASSPMMVEVNDHRVTIPTECQV